jgi:hypothetical protein
LSFAQKRKAAYKMQPFLIFILTIWGKDDKIKGQVYKSVNLPNLHIYYITKRGESQDER